ncbi:RelB antitoxin [mine drainage metagenome]|uniref:RelB antitoxin n=2 Tax=mine drainage metagenome TaxID=410659 RepID=T0Y6E0_9ZZZZ
MADVAFSSPPMLSDKVWATMWLNKGGHAMSDNAVVRARIDEHIKEEASAVLASMGLTVSDAFRLLLTRVAKEKALPFEPLIPNAETIAAVKQARRNNLQTVTLDELQAVLDADG